MNRLTAILSTFGMLVLITACGSVPPAPTDRFYRLQPVQVPSAPVALSGAVAVHAFSADSLYAERPIIYSDEASQRQLRQYHYHLWLYPPAQLVRENFLASLGGALNLAGDGQASNVIEGRIVSFERVLSGRNSSAVVALELSLKTDGKTRLHKTYRAEQRASDDSLGAFAMAMEQALGKIYTEFLADMARSR
ncbi:MAG: membrane integrity-associated transporter subunit PqiC [Propionivibrio sp.]|nr:membrane integrity-associated transporter subunit PqiC [Propionivibrio sp.]